MAERIEIQLSAHGAEAVAKALRDLAGKSQEFAKDLTAGSSRITSALGGTRGALQEVSSLMSQAGVNTGIFGQALGALGSPLGAAAAGVVAVGLAITTTTDYMKQNYEQLRQLQAVSGLAADDADQLADAWELLGGDAQALTQAMFKMSAEIDSGGKAMRALGVNIRDASGALKTEGDLFLEVRDKISQLGSASQRNAALIDIFGRSGRDMAAIFALSEEEFRKWLETAGKIGPSAEESMRVTREYTLAVNALSKEWNGLVETAGQRLLPALTAVVTVMRDLASLRPGQSGQSWAQWLNDIAAALPAPIAGLALLWQESMRAQKALDDLAKTSGYDFDLGALTRGSRGGGPAPEIKAVTDELAKMREQLEVMRAAQLDQPIVKLEQAFRAFAEKAGPAATAEMRKLTNEAIALTRAAQAVPELLARMKALADEGIADLKLGDVLLNAADAERQLADASRDLGASMAETTPKVEADAEALRKEAEAAALAAEALKQIAPLAGTLEAAFDLGGESFTNDLIKANRELRALQATSDLNAESIRKFGVSFEFLDEKTQANLVSLRAWNQEAANLQGAKDYADALQRIGVEAQLFGDRFNAADATIQAMEQRLRQLASTSKGEVTPEMRALATELEGLREFADLRDMFVGIFESAANALDTFVKGLILGTRQWADFGTMALQVLRSIAAEILSGVFREAIVSAGRTLFASLFGSGPQPSAAASGTPAPPGGATLPGSFIMLPNGTLAPVSGGAAGTASSVASSFGVGITGAQFATGNSILGSTLSGISTGWSGGFGGLTGAASGGWNAFIAAANSASALSVALAGVGAGVAAFGSIMDIAGGQIEAGIGGLVGGVALGAIGAYFAGPFGAFLGYALGDLLGSWIGGLFGGGPSEYEIKRMQAADEANQALGRLDGGFQGALQSGDIARILAALQAGGGGASGNSVRTELVLPANLAAQLGISGQQIGDEIVAQWSDITLDQFRQVIAAFKEQPGLIDLIRGSGDVPYLEQGDAAAIAQAIKEGAQSLLTAFIAMEEVRDRITTTADRLKEAAEQFLPPELANAFASQVDGVRDRMLAVVQSGLGAEEIQRQMDALAAELQAFAGIVQLYATVEQDIARLSGDLGTQLEGVILGIRLALDGAAQAVEDAQDRVDGAVTPEEFLAANAALREAILGRYELEMRLVAEIEAQMLNLLQTVAGPAFTSLANAALARLDLGDVAGIDALYARLVIMAQTAGTAAERIFAIAQGFQLVIALASRVATNLTNGPNLYSPAGMAQVAAGGPAPTSIATQIVQDIYSQAAPFFAAIQDEILGALDAGDFQGALAGAQSQAQAIQQVGQAAIAAVRQWEEEAVAATQAQAASMRTEITARYDAEIANIERLRDASAAALEAEISGIEAAAEARQQAIADEIEALETEQRALQEQARTAREWEGVVRSVGDFLQNLKLSNQAPTNPADQLALAQASFDQRLAAFNASPSAALAGDVQAAAQDLLTAGQNVFTRPSPEYQALFASVIAAMEGVQGIAGAKQGPATAADLEAQATKIADEIQALRDESQDIAEQAREQVDLLREQIRLEAGWAADFIREAEKNRAHDLALVDEWEQAQINAIRVTAQATIDGIVKGMADALEANARFQLGLMGIIEGQLKRQLDEITGGKPIQVFLADRAKATADYLKDIRDDIRDFVTGLPEAAEGRWNTAGGLHMLHPGEMVVPAREAALFREGVGVAIRPTPTVAMSGERGERPVNITVNVTVQGDGDAEKIKRVLAKELRDGPTGQMLVERARR